MRHLQISRSVIAAAKVAGLVTLLAASGNAAAQASISTTKHNLGSTGTGANHVSTGTDEICVFCHTPHGANTGVAAPLWNKGLPASTYTTYSTANSSTIDGKVLSVGSVSLACLSCHDGTQAMDNFINAPGSGGYNPTGARPSPAYTWTGSDTLSGASLITNIGTDLTNDHPIGIQYCGGGITWNGTASIGTCNDPDFKTPVATSINSTPVWWVDTAAGTANTRQKTDMILYTRDFGTVGSPSNQPSVECASCHDPHVGAPNATFLRIPNSGSAVCLACHTK